MGVIIATFKTPDGNYVYDRETNSLLSVSDIEWISFRRIEGGFADESDWKLLKRYKNQGYLQESCLRKIEHPATSYMRHQLESNMLQLNLQIVQSCNLRCSYCTYGGGYEHQRTHTDKTMTMSTMKKAVDFLMSHSRNVEDVVLGFYGGEPLLKIDIIKACIEYVKTFYRGRSVNYTVTTNGTIFSDENIQFLQENNFIVSISLDGPKDLHDKNRVFADGRGSFDVIMTNLEYIKTRYPEFFSKISFLVTVSPGTDFSCTNDFFNASDIMSDNTIRQTIVNAFSSKEDVLYDDLYTVTYSYNHMKVLLAALGMYSKEKVSTLFTTILVDAERIYENLSKVKLTEKAHPSGPCLPGVMRPFVACDGSLYPCERVNEDSDVMKIGHVDSGFDIKKVDAILNIGKVTDVECKSCWNFMHCGLCVSSSDGGTLICKDLRLKNCEAMKNSTIDKMMNICLLLENGYDFERKTI